MNVDLRAMDIMQREVITLGPDTTLADAAAAMEVHRISSAPVVNRSEQLIGVISKTDIVHYQNSAGDSGPPRLVSECMYPAPIACNPGDDLRTVATILRRNAIHHVFVTKNERVIGVISSLDLAEPLITALDLLREANTYNDRS